jgi:hypothetical protein
MYIEQTLEIPADYRLSLELPHSIPIGSRARVAITISSPTLDSLTAEQPAISYLGILNGAGAGMEAHRKMEAGEKNLEEAREKRLFGLRP